MVPFATVIACGAVILVNLSFAVAGKTYVTVSVPSAFLLTLVAVLPFMVAVVESVNS